MPPISFKKRKSIISQYPLFKELSSNLLDELVNLTIEKRYDPGDIIVTKDDVVDSVYFIAKGEIELDREVKEKGYCQLVPQAILREGETIGLNQVGFFSQTGFRTATLKALSECVIFGWEIETLNDFLQKYPSINESMKQASEMIQRINFIKRVEPFAELPKEQLAWLSTNLEEINVLAGTILFRIGDEGKECYLVKTGEVEITLLNKEGIVKKLSTIVPPMLFGETALLTSTKRSSNARMTQSGKLLVIKKEQLDKLMQHHSTTESMMLLSIEKTRPIHSESIEHFHRTSADGEDIVVLKDMLRGKYFQLSEEGWFIWQHLDGTNTLEDLAVELFKFKRVFCPEAIADTIFKLSDAGFVLLPELPLLLTDAPQENPTFLQKLDKMIGRLLYIEFTFDDIDTWLSNTYEAGVKWLFSLMGRIFITIIIGLGLFVFGAFASEAFEHLQQTNHLFVILFCLILANFLSIWVHELAHAYTTKYFKRQVHRAGILFSWVSFMAFIDTSDMWLSDKRSKIIVSLAGPIADLTVAGLVGMGSWIIPQKDVALLFWLLALSLYYGVFKNLNPFWENDGYFVMKDALDQPNLREISFRRFLGLRDSSTIKRDGERTYLYICILFMVLDVFLAFLFQYYLRMLLPHYIMGIPTVNLSWLIPMIVLSKYIINLWVLLRRLK